MSEEDNSKVGPGLYDAFWHSGEEGRGYSQVKMFYSAMLQCWQMVHTAHPPCGFSTSELSIREAYPELF